MKIDKRVVIFGMIMLLIVWGTFFFFLIRYGDAVKGNPIAFGAKRFGLDCVCTDVGLPGAFMIINRTGNVTYEYPAQSTEQFKVNFSDWDKFNE